MATDMLIGDPLVHTRINAARDTRPPPDPTVNASPIP